MLEVIAAPTVPAMWPTAPSVATLYGVAPKVAIAAKSMADFPTSDPNWEMHWPDQSKRKSRWRSNVGARGKGTGTNARVAGVKAVGRSLPSRMTELQT